MRPDSSNNHFQDERLSDFLIQYLNVQDQSSIERKLNTIYSNEEDLPVKTQNNKKPNPYQTVYVPKNTMR